MKRDIFRILAYFLFNLLLYYACYQFLIPNLQLMANTVKQRFRLVMEHHRHLNQNKTEIEVNLIDEYNGNF